MGRIWDEEMDKKYEDYKHSLGAWEIMHEESGFEDTGFNADPCLSDLDGAETHMHFVEIDMREEQR